MDILYSKLKKLRDSIAEWLYGIRRPTLIHYFSFVKGLGIIVASAVATVEGYELYIKLEYGRTRIRRVEKKRNPGRPSEQIPIITKEIVELYLVPYLFEYSQVVAWGLFEDFLKDSLWLVATRRGERSFRSEARDIKKLNHKAILGRFQDLGLDLSQYSDYCGLVKLKPHRNILAHTGVSVGYKSEIEHALMWEEKEVKPLIQFARHYTEQFGKYPPSEKIVQAQWDLMMRNEEEFRQRHHKLEERLCSTIELMWKVGDFIRGSVLEPAGPRPMHGGNS